MSYRASIGNIRCQVSALWICLGLIVLATPVASGSDWLRFRGPNGSGASSDTAVPASWNDTENVRWKTELPGPGLSSPIVVGDKIFITCYSGYGVNPENPGDMKQLTRHLLCVTCSQGEVVWSKAIPSTATEDEYKGFITEHGYASQSPASDGQQVYVFCGKSGVFAFDLEGNQIWHADVGQASGRMKWGSAASPILYEDLVIVNASDESESLVVLQKKTGEVVWRKTSPQLAGNWSTPVLAASDSGTELVLAVNDEVWGLDPATGEQKWKATGFGNRGYSTSIIADSGIVYCAGGMLGGPSFAIRTGGKGDVTDSHVLWSGQSYESIISPVLIKGQLVGGTNRGIAYAVDAKDGQRLSQLRLAGSDAVSRRDTRTTRRTSWRTFGRSWRGRICVTRADRRDGVPDHT